MMFNDDDGVEPQFKAVDKYYFEVTKNEHVCFSILPFQFDENDEVGDCDSKNKVYLRGVMDKILYPVHKQVVAWRVGLDCEQPNILVLSTEGNWIKLLNPWKCYKDEIARSILITVQMLHFVRKQHNDKRSLWGRLWDHLNEVFDKLGSKPAIDDVRKHHALIKLFQERDPIFMKLKILHRFIGDITKPTEEPKALGTKVQFTGSGQPRERNNDTDSDYDDDNNNDSEYNDNSNSDGDTDNDDGADTLCALCDDGGNLLSCIGQCKRAFHPKKKDGSESKCKTLGYTSAQLKEIDSYLCKNCKYKIHQCFKCGELEPSADPNAKVFKCNNAACGHFYHPKCVAKLLEPDDSDGSCELAKRIMAGMSFTCPVHWCFECGRMEDRTQRAMQFAVCRRCPKSYHRECLPREISFKTKDKNIKQRAWELSGIIILYCLDHKICESTGNADRGHIKFPCTQKITQSGDLAKKKGKTVGKRKRSINKGSKKSTKVLNRIPRAKFEHTQNSLEHMVLEPVCSAMNLKENLQLETSSAVGSKRKKRKAIGQKKERSSTTSCNSAKMCVGSSVQDKLMNCPPLDNDAELGNKICRIPEDKDCNGKEKSPAHSGKAEEATNKDASHGNNEQNDVLGKIFVDLHTEVDQSKFESRAVRRMELGENADGHYSTSGQEISMGENQMCQSLCEQELRLGKGKNARNGSAKSGMGNGVVTPDHIDDNRPEKLLHVPHVDKMIITDGLHTQPEYGCDNDQEVNGGHAKSGLGDGVVTPDHIDDNHPEKLLHVPHVHKMTITDVLHTQPEYGCDKDQEVNGSHSFQEKPNSSRCGVNPKAMGIHTSGNKSRKKRELKKKAAEGNKTDLDKDKRCNLIEDEKEAHCDDNTHQCASCHEAPIYQDHRSGNSGPSGSRHNDENGGAEVSEYKTRQNTEPPRREILIPSTRENSSSSKMGRASRDKPRKRSPKRQRTYRDVHEQHPAINEQRYEQLHHVSYSSNYNYGQRSHLPLRPVFAPTGFDANRPRSCPGELEHDITGWHRPHLDPGSHEYFSSGWHSPYPARPENADYSRNVNNLPHGYDESHNFMHGEYREVGFDPTGMDPAVQRRIGSAYQPRTDVNMEGRGAAYGGCTRGYGARSNYTFALGSRRPAAGSVTDRYAPRLEQTNNPQRG